jgi:hypothetical protein
VLLWRCLIEFLSFREIQKTGQDNTLFELFHCFDNARYLSCTS